MGYTVNAFDPDQQLKKNELVQNRNRLTPIQLRFYFLIWTNWEPPVLKLGSGLALPSISVGGSVKIILNDGQSIQDALTHRYTYHRLDPAFRRLEII